MGQDPNAPSNDSTVVAPRPTITRGCTASISAMSQGRHAITSARLGFWCIRRLPGLPGELEMFDGIGLKRQLTVDAGLVERVHERSSCRADEGQPFAVLPISRLFVHHHDRCMTLSMAENRLCGLFIQGAAPTPACRDLKRTEAEIWAGK